MQQTVLGMKTAQRARALPDSEHRRTHQGEVAGGATSAAVRAATEEAVTQHQCDHYTRRPGIAPLCQAVAARLAALGAPLGENDVVISGSREEARYVALRSLGAGKTVYVHAPTAEPYAAALLFGGARLIPLHEESALPVEAAGVLVIGRTFGKGGEQPTAARLQQLAAWAAAANLTVVVDESSAPTDGYTPFAALPGMHARTLTVGGFGEPGLEAWQVSWFGGPKALLTPVRDLKQSITICTTAPSQFAALAALQEAAAHARVQP